ncbi:MAG: peptidylprolyl isomerase [Tepidiphilus sp.]|nr:peptidylprolyl isomerase [Tepidiphilus sp.]
MLAHIGKDETVTVDDVERYIARRVDARSLLGTEEGLRRLIDEMVFTRLLVREGQTRGVERKSSVDERFDDVYALAVFNKIVPACEKPKDETEAKAYYEQHPDAFQIPPRARIARVALRIDDKVGDEPAFGWLLMQATEMAAGRKRFEDALADAQKVRPNERMGDLGFIELSDRAPIVKAIASAKAGDLVGPYRDGDYVYLFKVLEKREAQRLPWEQVRVHAATRAVEYCREQARASVHDELFARYQVQLEEEAIRQAADPLARAKRPQGPDITR